MSTTVAADHLEYIAQIRANLPKELQNRQVAIVYNYGHVYFYYINFYLHYIIVHLPNCAVRTLLG